MTAWRDRFGTVHAEGRPAGARDERTAERVVGWLERAWASATEAERAALAEEALGSANPVIVREPADPGWARWTWLVVAPDAHAVLLWTNPVFDHADVSRAELTRLAGSDLWTLCLRLPSALRTSYRIAVHTEASPPPWRLAQGRRPVILAAMTVARPDERCPDAVVGSRDTPSSVAAGPYAPPLWPAPVRPAPPAPLRPVAAGGRRKGAAGAGDASPLVELDVPGDSGVDRLWVLAPRSATRTPLLVLFDGDVWRHTVPDLIGRAVAAGVIAPLHVVMVDSGDVDARWGRLGVPGGLVDAVLERVLPRVRAEFDVDPAGDATVVAGQSLGGIAALWALSLGEGQVRHAIAQSPSLWRFGMAEPLLAAPGWRSIALQAGTYEGDMLDHARGMHRALHDDDRRAGRRVSLTPFEGGHDWACWRAGLVGPLAEALRPS
ncbi:alpha/beta hydrolase-fold protein [Propioniciclava soli]|uniref:Alpha/beta hydrolase-fold protein n=1 Tax=Propioniciclava soli TaxID=2775081 RepID=A0ABZ3C8Y9_9ACTN